MLQRIAVYYLIAGIIFLFTKVRGQIIAIVSLNVVYWCLMTLYPTPGCGPGSLTMECNFARYIDGLLLSGHMWSGTKVWDPEGIVGTLPAISSVLFGVLTGPLLRHFSSSADQLKWLVVQGAALLALAYALSIWMPFNKELWTTPFALLMAGLASLVFAVWFWVADIGGLARWFRPFEIFGTNAILVFLLSGSFAKFMGHTRSPTAAMDLLLWVVLPPRVSGSRGAHQRQPALCADERRRAVPGGILAVPEALVPEVLGGPPITVRNSLAPVPRRRSSRKTCPCWTSARRMGFDAVEIIPFDPDNFPAAQGAAPRRPTSGLTHQHGLRHAGRVQHHLARTRPCAGSGHRASRKRLIDLSNEAGARVFGGMIYCGWGYLTGRSCARGRMEVGRRGLSARSPTYALADVRTWSSASSR
ncbi:MAG: hypothetical protein MZV70_29295 [Desulfobacterales bacterium]|nr:hypothetical protein [Desulfobacterales bacterium]